jgi:Recombination directionality factor-like
LEVKTRGFRRKKTYGSDQPPRYWGGPERLTMGHATGDMLPQSIARYARQTRRKGLRGMATAMIRTLPKKLTELGRLRIGNREKNKTGTGTHPHKLDYFRLTSANPSLLHCAAELYGGEVQPWIGDGAPLDDQGRPAHYEVYTTVNALDVLIPTLSAISIQYEEWSGDGCRRRCDGTTIVDCPLNEALVGTACTCPTDERERAALATQGKACSRRLRLNVLLPDLPGIGTWRLDTQGEHATAELQGTLDMLQMAGQAHNIIEAVLRLEPRVTKRPGKGEGRGTLKYSVPVLWPKYTPRQILAGAAHVLLTPPDHPHLAPPVSATALLYGDAETAPLEAQINALLTAKGVGPEEQAAWWAEMDRKYAGRTAFTLNLLYEKLQTAATKQDTAQQGRAFDQAVSADLEAEDAQRKAEASSLNLFQQEEEAERRAYEQRLEH